MSGKSHIKIIDEELLFVLRDRLCLSFGWNVKDVEHLTEFFETKLKNKDITMRL